MSVTCGTPYVLPSYTLLRQRGLEEVVVLEQRGAVEGVEVAERAANSGTQATSARMMSGAPEPASAAVLNLFCASPNGTDS